MIKKISSHTITLRGHIGEATRAVASGLLAVLPIPLRERTKNLAKRFSRELPGEQEENLIKAAVEGLKKQKKGSAF